MSISHLEMNEQINCLVDMDERLNFLESADTDLMLEPQPYDIVCQFFDVQTFEHAMRVAVAFMHRLGPVVISRQSSYTKRRFVTVMDEIEDALTNCENSTSIWLIADAFKTLEFKHARDCDPRLLSRLYYADVMFEDEADRIQVEFGLLNRLNEHFTQELIEFTFHPNSIHHWIDINHDSWA